MLQVQHYIFVVQAQDTGRPSLSSTVTVYFNVVDLNDNAPLFDPMSYSNEVFENITVGSRVVTVSATDLDSGKYINHLLQRHSQTRARVRQRNCI
jgi:protocadherin Fat 4